MKCPFCLHLENRVIDSRLSKDGHAIRRRRECVACDKRFTTYERVEISLPWVVKKDGRREAFERDKLKTGIFKACEKRPVSADSVERFVTEVEQKLQESGEREISSRVIGQQVMKFLYDMDEVAYVRFASVYRSFKDVKEFMTEIEELVRTEGDRKGRELDT